LRNGICVPGFGFSVHGPGKRQTLSETSQIRSGDDGATKVKKSLLGNGNIPVEMSLYVGPERMGHETEMAVEIRKVDEFIA
jgi:hypothetical protein